MKHSRDIEIKRLKSMLAHAIEEKEHAEQGLRELGGLPDSPTPSTGEGIYKLVEYLSKHGGSIVSSNDLNPDLINQAKASNRMWVDDNSLGYVWEPPIAGKFPETPEDVEMFEWCYPIPVELKKEDSERMLKNILNGTRQPATPTPEVVPEDDKKKKRLDDAWGDLGGTLYDMGNDEPGW